MRIGMQLGYWGAGPPDGVGDAIALGEELEFHSVWAAEAYGSDAFTPLAWHASATRTLQLGTAIAQMSARTPAATAMAALTLDHLSEGRFNLGLGVSGPQVVEGWYGQPFARPLARTREYVAIVRAILARDEPLASPGPHYPLPLVPPQGSGLGKALRSTVHPRRADMPILLGAEGPKNVALAAEIADGWLPLWFSPKLDGFYRDALDEGFARPGARRSADTFEVVTTLMMVPGDDVEAAADLLRPMLALYIGGMGAPGANFHADVFVRMGYEGVCRDIQKLYVEGRKDEAVAHVPLALVDDVALVGPVARIRDRLQPWRGTVTTTWLVPAHPDLMRLAAELLS